MKHLELIFISLFILGAAGAEEMPDLSSIFDQTINLDTGATLSESNSSNSSGSMGDLGMFESLSSEFTSSFSSDSLASDIVSDFGSSAGFNSFESGSGNAQIESIISRLPAAEQSRLRAALAAGGPDAEQQFLAGFNGDSGGNLNGLGGLELTAASNINDPTVAYQVCLRVCDRDGAVPGASTNGLFSSSRSSGGFTSALSGLETLGLAGGGGSCTLGCAELIRERFFEPEEPAIDPAVLALIAEQFGDGEGGGDISLLLQLAKSGNDSGYGGDSGLDPSLLSNLLGGL